MDRDQDAAGSHWDRMLAAGLPPRVRWWDDTATIRHINRLVCGEPLDGLHAGFRRRITTALDGASDVHAVSVGCGTGAKEVHLLVERSVAQFDCFELSAGAVEVGRKMAFDMGLADRMRFHLADAFATDLPDDFGLVYWNNALHHMPNAMDAVAWSKSRLRPGGLFAMDDFVGPSRFQWSATNMYEANLLRSQLSDRLLANPWVAKTLVSRKVVRPTPDEVIAMDPSEAMDSGRILDAIRREFPQAEIILTGGCLYHIAMNDLFWNFTKADAPLLEYILERDAALTRLGETHYAVALARK